MSSRIDALILNNLFLLGQYTQLLSNLRYVQITPLNFKILPFNLQNFKFMKSTPSISNGVKPFLLGMI